LFFQADYDEIELQKISYDVILMTLWPLCHWKTSPKKRHKIFPFSKTGLKDYITAME